VQLKRRDFLRAGFGAATLGGPRVVWGGAVRKASDVVQLGPDKVRLARMAIGTGTKGGSIQRQLGVQGVADMLRFGYDQGLFWWDTADGYRTHPHVREALKGVPREKVAILTKTRARDAERMRADLDRFRQELGTDYLDIVLLHAVMTPTWEEERKGAMEALAEAREKGIVRSYGVSCHSLEALQVAAKSPWLRVALVRINPAGMLMDAGPDVVVSVMRQTKAAGKGVMGMKILGEGGLRDRVDECLRYALSLDCLDCFTIGPANRDELADLIKRLPPASQTVKAA